MSAEQSVVAPSIEANLRAVRARIEAAALAVGGSLLVGVYYLLQILFPGVFPPILPL